MPKQKSIIKLKGTLNGVTYYQLNGQDISRKANGPSKDRIYNDPAFAAVKANVQEFGGASKAATAIRMGLGATGEFFQDSYIAGRMSGACRKIIQYDTDSLGNRDFKVANAPNLLQQVQLRKAQPFSQIYQSKYTVTANNTRTQITIHIPESAPYNLKQKPKKATHLILTAAVSLVASYHWHPEKETYLPSNTQQNTKGTAVQSEPLECNTTYNNISLVLQPIPKTAIAPEITCTLWLGITYGYLEQGTFKALLSPQAMQCIACL